MALNPLNTCRNCSLEIIYDARRRRWVTTADERARCAQSSQGHTPHDTIEVQFHGSSDVSTDTTS